MINIWTPKKKNNFELKMVSWVLIVSFFLTSSILPAYAQGSIQTVLNLPVPGTMVSLTEAFRPAIIKGLNFYPDNPLEFNFIIHTGDLRLEGQQLEAESKKLIKYFLASLTVPEEEMWVNLSPYENDRIIPERFGHTEMGRDLLAQDYLLKQLTASLIYPEEEIGETFWETIYEKAYNEYGVTNLPVNTFNKIWIVPKEAVVAEKGTEVFVINKHLKVMLEEDYVALQKNLGVEDFGLDSIKKEDIEQLSGVSANVVREVLIPEIEKEINRGENFASLRQIYNSMILATWFKKNLKESLLGKVYVDQNKVKGIDIVDKQIKQKIYNQYVEAFAKGVYNYVRDDYDPTTHQIIPRKYFSGGAVALNSEEDYTGLDLDDKAMVVSPSHQKMLQRTAVETAHQQNNNELQDVHIALLENSGDADFAMAVDAPTPSGKINKSDLISQVGALQQELQQYRAVATVDHLTQLPNRRAFYSHVLSFINRLQSGKLGRRYSDNLMVMYLIDINEFKFLNEAFGHIIGDEALKGLGALMNQMLKGEDAHLFARVGGEEFYGMMEQKDLKVANAFLKKLREALVANAELVFPSLNNPLIVSGAMDEKVRAISRDISQAIDQAIARKEIAEDYDKDVEIAQAKKTGRFNLAYAKYMKEDLGKIKNGLIHQFVFQGITDGQGSQHSAEVWAERNIFSLLNLASTKLKRVDVTISAGSTLLEKENLGESSAPEILARVMNEADIAMHNSKKDKNKKMVTVQFDPSDAEMSKKMSDVDVRSAVSQIETSLKEGFNTVAMVSNFAEMSESELTTHRSNLQEEISQLKLVSEGDIVSGSGIFNRRGLENQFNSMLAAMRKAHQPRDALDFLDRRVAERREIRLQYILIDLGDLKVFNDTYGYTMGDELIHIFAQMAKEVVGEYGVVARTGGDEFVIVLEGTAVNAASAMRKVYGALLQVEDFELSAGMLRVELEKLSGADRTKFLKAVRRQMFIQSEALKAKGITLDITLMDDSRLEELPLDVLDHWKPVFSSGSASYEVDVMEDWSAELVERTLSVAADKAQEQAKSEMRATGSFVTHSAKELGIDTKKISQEQDYAMVSDFNRTVRGQFFSLSEHIRKRTDQELSMFVPTVSHRGSLSDIIQTLTKKGLLEKGKGLDAFAEVWTDIHDTAYRGAEINFDDPEFERTLKDTWRIIGEAVELDPVEVENMSAEAYQLLKNNSDPAKDFVGNLFITKILGHGSVGMALNAKELTDQGMAYEDALATAMLAAAHHPGFPINFVEDTVLPSMKKTLPNTKNTALLPIMLIDMEGDFRTLVMADYIQAQMNNRVVTDIRDLRQQYKEDQGKEIINYVARGLKIEADEIGNLFTINAKRETMSQIARGLEVNARDLAKGLKARRQASANYLRMKIADYVADRLGSMDRANARMHALLGYGLDRITPANPGNFETHSLTGDIKSTGGEIIDKKYGLVAGTNITQHREMTLAQVFRRSVENVEEERDSFLQSVEDLKVGLDESGVDLLDELKDGLSSTSDQLITLARNNQDQALGFIDEYLRNSKTLPFSGHLKDIEVDIAIVEDFIGRKNFNRDFSVAERSAASYLLRSLKALNTKQVKTRVDKLMEGVDVVDFGKQLPAETTLTLPEVLKEWVRLGGTDEHARASLSNLKEVLSQTDPRQAEVTLKGKMKEEQESLIKNKTEQLYRISINTIEQAQRDGANRMEVLGEAQEVLADYAMVIGGKKTKVGGINLNAAMLDLQIRRDGKGIPLPIVNQPMGDMKIDGFLPIIIDITPVINVPLLLTSHYNQNGSDEIVDISLDST